MSTDLGNFLVKIKANKAKLAKAIEISTDRMNAICNEDEAILYGKEFYLIIKETGYDLDEVATILFGNRTPLKPNGSVDKNKSKFGQYMAQYINNQKGLAKHLNINESRFSNLMTDKNNGPYAYEVYDIAIAFHEKPSVVFEKIFGARERLII